MEEMFEMMPKAGMLGVICVVLFIAVHVVKYGLIFGVYGIYAAYLLGSKLLGNHFSSHSNVRWYYSLHQLSDEVNLKKIKTVLRFDLKVLAEIPATICWHLMRRKASTAWH